MAERISREELVKTYNIEITFFDSLEESGLVNPEVENNIKYLLYEELPAFERYTNLHYDLDVNVPGLEVIENLVRKLNALNKEKAELVQKINFYREIFE